MQLRDYQQLAVDHAVDFLRGAEPAARKLYAAPTGTGKSYMQRAIQNHFPDCWIVTPKVEIIDGLLHKCGLPAGLNEEATLQLAWDEHISTPIRLRNAMVRGEGPHITHLILDEAHHDEADSWQDIHLLTGYCPAVGFTASPFRGTPRSTASFREKWGDPVWVITFSEAAQRGVLSMPVCETVPLVDDDLIEANNGELIAAQVNSTTVPRLGQAAALLLRWLDTKGTTPLDVPTMFSVPSRLVAHQLGEYLRPLAYVVTGETSYGDRRAAFDACVGCRGVLIQIGVVSEGVDLPIRRLIDLSPCLSPVKWLQQFGRITRPGGGSHYVCCNRNLMRHGYLLDGMVPESAYKQAQDAFGGPGKRATVRAIGLEAIGRLKPIELRLASGITTVAYAITGMDGYKRTDYFVIVHPTRPDPIWAKKESFRNPETGSMAYGSWHRCDPPSDLSGFSSIPPRSLTDKQKAWWKRSAPGFGLADEEPNQKSFQVLPVLCDTRVSLR